MVDYPGRELEAMEFAENYHRWILGLMQPFVGTRLVEVGAGIGGFSRLLLERKPASLTLLEPSAMFENLEAGFRDDKTATAITLYHDVLASVADEIRQTQQPDSVFYINVLEHIENDESELSTAFEMLSGRGHVLIFVPAQPFLYSAIDRELGHFRRYRLGELRSKCETAGFRIRAAMNFDIFGILPWFIKYRLFGSTMMENGLVSLYDKAIVPVARRLETVIPPPIGKNVLVVGEK